MKYHILIYSFFGLTLFELYKNGNLNLLRICNICK